MQPFPAASANQTSVTVHALSAGFLTCPEHYFVHPSVAGARKTFPSLSFLIQHHSQQTGKLTRLIFDLGIRKNTATYPDALKKHMAGNLSVTTEPDVSDSLAKGNLTPKDIDFVVFSHMHWDHVGTPSDFKTSRFVVGKGSLELLASAGNPPPADSTSFFEAELLPRERTIELPGVSEAMADSVNEGEGGLFENVKWKKFGPLKNVIDIFSDGSLFVIDSPGHLDGHLNLLARLAPGKLLYLAGDTCHDRRIMRKELDMATWKNLHGEVCCLHANKEEAEKEIELIAGLEKMDGVEVVLAHDIEWLDKEENKKRFWPAKM